LGRDFAPPAGAAVVLAELKWASPYLFFETALRVSARQYWRIPPGLG
jgi:hypothetical protein